MAREGKREEGTRAAALARASGSGHGAEAAQDELRRMGGGTPGLECRARGQTGGGGFCDRGERKRGELISLNADHLTDDEGRYRIVKLKPGTFKIKAMAKGFGIQETPGIVTVSAQNVEKDFKLSPADVRAETSVTVSEDDGPAVDTTRITVSGTITAREVEEIPNNTRNALDLVLTLGGTSEEQLSTSGLADDRGANPRTAPLEQGNFSISGGTAYSNNITIDGLDNNDDRSSRDRFQPSLESVAEVQVIANQFSAEYGRASGGRVNIRTRSGGNKFRGRAFMFFRDESVPGPEAHEKAD